MKLLSICLLLALRDVVKVLTVLTILMLEFVFQIKLKKYEFKRN